MKREKERYRRGRPKPSAGGDAEELEPAWCTMDPMVTRKSWSSRY